MGGKTDGTSGPGVGAVMIVVQEGGVGKMILIVGPAVTLTGDVAVVVDVAQAESRKERRRMKARFFRIEIPGIHITGKVIADLFDCLLKFFEGCHPCDGVDKILQ